MLILEAPNLALCTSVIKRRKYTQKKLSVNAVCFKNHQSVFSHLEHFEIVFHKIMCFKNRERVGGNCPENGGCSFKFYNCNLATQLHTYTSF